MYTRDQYFERGNRSIDWRHARLYSRDPEPGEAEGTETCPCQDDMS
jgi:hypothetical protein